MSNERRRHMASLHGLGTNRQDGVVSKTVKRWAMHHPCCVDFVFGSFGSLNFMANCVIIKLKQLLLSDICRIQE